MDNANIGVRPISAVGPTSPWAYWSCAEGSLVSTTTDLLVNRAWGTGKVAVPDLTFQGTVGTMWSATPGRCDLQDGGSNKYFRADLDPVTAAAFSFAGSGVLLLWAHLNTRVDATDTGTHSLLQIGGGGNSKHGFDMQYHQSLRRVQLVSRSGADVSTANTAIGQANALTAGTDATVAVLVDFSTLSGNCYVNGAASSGGTFGPTSGTMTLDAADTANFITVGCSMSGGAPTTTQMADCLIQRLGIMKLSAMPSNMSEIMLSLAARKGTPGQWINAL